MAFAVLNSTSALVEILEHNEDVCPCVFRVDQEDQELALGTLRRLDL